ncbi:MAG TPA: hypothetical protein VIT20_06795 [Propionibacteriaceae bacterium]
MNTTDIQTLSGPVTKITSSGPVSAFFRKLVASYVAPYEALHTYAGPVDASIRLRNIPVA